MLSINPFVDLLYSSKEIEIVIIQHMQILAFFHQEEK